MSWLNNLRPAKLAGWSCLVLLLAASSIAAVEPADNAQLLRRADSVRSANDSEFAELLKRLDADKASLLPAQRLHLDYLQAWQLAYRGDYTAALPLLDRIIATSQDVNLRSRAGMTIVNLLAISSRNQEAYTRLGGLLDMLPRISDGEARSQVLFVAGLLHTQVGEYDLAGEYAEKLIRENWDGKGICKGSQTKLEALYKSGQLRLDNRRVQEGIDACLAQNEHIFANFIRSYAAHQLIDTGQFADALELLRAHQQDVQATNYPPLIAEFDSLLAQAHWHVGQLTQARRFAQRAVVGGVKNQVTRSRVDAYRVLYGVARQQGQHAAALEYHEKYAEADKGYLTESSAKALAYQTVRQRVLDKKQQIDALNKRNQVLLLQQKVSKSAAQTRGLYILLLLSVLAFIAMWLYKTKRSQLHFMKLARRDGLTGIFNRAHFADAAEAILTYCRKGQREACVVLLDLDNFKLVNDTHGHAAGDVVLKRAVQACQAHLRSIDIIGRLGGEEFGIVLPDCDPEHARALAEQFRLGITDISSGEGGVGFPVSASFGVTSSRWSSYNLRQLIIHADKALYVAKNTGRNRVEVFDSASAEPPATPASQTGIFDRRRA